MNDPFSLERWYSIDESISDLYRNYMVYDHNEFVCTGLTQKQAIDFCHGANLVDLGILELML